MYNSDKLWLFLITIKTHEPIPTFIMICIDELYVNITVLIIRYFLGYTWILYVHIVIKRIMTLKS